MFLYTTFSYPSVFFNQVWEIIKEVSSYCLLVLCSGYKRQLANVSASELYCGGSPFRSIVDVVGSV